MYVQKARSASITVIMINKVEYSPTDADFFKLQVNNYGVWKTLFYINR